MAVAEGFEPSDGGYPSHAFEACSLGRSDTPPRESLPAADGHPDRCRAKNSSSGAAHCAARTPPRTSGRCVSRRSRTTSHSEPTAPVFGSHAPNTNRATRAITTAPAHIVHGSTVTASVAPSSRQPSPTTCAAARNARISACAVGIAQRLPRVDRPRQLDAVGAEHRCAHRHVPRAGGGRRFQGYPDEVVVRITD